MGIKKQIKSKIINLLNEDKEIEELNLFKKLGLPDNQYGDLFADCIEELEDEKKIKQIIIIKLREN